MWQGNSRTGPQSKLRTPEKYEAVAKNIERFIEALP